MISSLGMNVSSVHDLDLGFDRHLGVAEDGPAAVHGSCGAETKAARLIPQGNKGLFLVEGVAPGLGLGILLVAQGFDGIETGGFAGGVIAEKDADGGGE